MVKKKSIEVIGLGEFVQSKVVKFRKQGPACSFFCPRNGIKKIIFLISQAQFDPIWVFTAKLKTIAWNRAKPEIGISKMLKIYLIKAKRNEALGVPAGIEAIGVKSVYMCALGLDA